MEQDTKTERASVDDLIERLKKAMGPDRVLDCDIWMSRHMEVEAEFWKTVVAANIEGRGDIPRYTGGIDAALTLVPEGAVWHVMTDYGDLNRAKVGPPNNPSASIYRDESRFLFVQADGETPAIALCIAALKSRSHQ